MFKWLRQNRTNQPALTSRQTLQSRKRKLAGAVQSALESLETRTLYSFTAPVPYAGGVAPVAATAIDVNGDGKLDVVTAYGAYNTIGVMLGNGDGSFQVEKSSPIGYAPVSSYTGAQAGIMSTSDFNNDGKMDVTVVSANNGITLLGNGDGTFQAPLVSYIGNSPARMTSGDVNGDGRADLVVANTSGTVNILLGNGDGTFAAPASYLAGPSPQDVKIVDLNHDGKADLVVADAVSAGSVSVLIGNGDGTFQPYHSFAAFSAPYRMVVGDFNGDGNDDVAVANSYTSSCITILNGNGDGTFQPYHSYDTGSQPWDLQAEDFDGDGHKDLVESNGGSLQIEYNNGDGTFAVPTSTFSAGVTFAAGDFNGDGTADIAGENSGTTSVLLNTASSQVNLAGAVSFQLTAPATTSAGAAVPLTITAVDADGNVATGFLGTVHVSTTDPRMGGFTFTFLATDNGSHTFATGFALYTVGNQTINVAGPALLTGTTTIGVTGAQASKFSISSNASAEAGSPVSFTIVSQDAYGNLANGYVGTVHFTSTDASADLPTDYTFTLADAGIHTFSAVLKTAGLQRISARDTINAAAVGTSASIAVSATSAVSFGMVGGGGHIGSPHTVTITAYDSFGNVATGYNGTLHFTASDAQIVLPADGPITNGVGNFSVTPMTLGAQTLSVSDRTSGFSATENIFGTPGDATHFVVSPISGGVAGTVQSVTITAYDAFGNIAVDYSGSVLFSSSDYQASLPFYTFTAADTGTHTFTVVLKTAGIQSLTVRDYYNGAVASSIQTGILITAGTAVTATITPVVGTVAGVAQSFTVTARDAYGNAASSFRDTLTFSTSDTQAALVASYAFTAADAGSHVFSLTFKSSGGQTFTMTDTNNLAISYFQRDINIAAAAMKGFAFRAPSNITAGLPFSLTVTAVDAFGNTVIGYTGKIHFSGPSGSGNLLPADYTFNAADAGTHTFTVTVSSIGTQTLTVTDLVTSSFLTSTPLNVKASSGGGGGGGGGTGGGGGSGGGGKKV